MVTYVPNPVTLRPIAGHSNPISNDLDTHKWSPLLPSMVTSARCRPHKHWGCARLKVLKSSKCFSKKNNVGAVVVTTKPTAKNPFIGGRHLNAFPP